jgi:Protein NO VEIN, C-terminal
LHKIKSINHLEGILESDPAAILTWLAIDGRASAWRFHNEDNATLADRRGNDINYRHYSGGLPSYVHWKVKNTEWLPVSENRKAKPGLCMYGERALEKILPTPADFKHSLFETYQIDRLKLRNAWDNAGVLPNISFLTPKQIIDILIEVPIVDPEGKSARALYRNILENIEVDRHDWKEPVKIFKKKGQMWGKGPDGHKYYPVSELRHADTDDIPEQLINRINVVDIPKRVGALKVQNIFGVEPIDRRKIKIEIKNFDKSSRYSKVQDLFQTCKPYLYALRQVKTKQYQEIGAFKRLDLVLCRTVQLSLTYENIKLELSLTEPYQWILMDDQAFILEDPQEEATFRSDIFVDSIGSILATILRLENGGDFARILRCESNGDRIKLLRRILGEMTLPDLEDLKKEFTQADRQPIIIYPPEKEAAKESHPATQETEKEEQEAKGTQEQTAAPQVNMKDVTVTKEEHHPIVTERRPIALRNKIATGTSPITTLRRITDGDICEEKVLIFEESDGRWPIKVSHIQGYEGPRCDVISFQTEGDWQEYNEDPISKRSLIKRFIEVKGRSNEKGAIPLKGNELDAARTYSEQYYIYRLYEKNNLENVLLILNNPLEHKEALENIIEVDPSRAIETERYHLTFGEVTDTIKDEDSERVIEKVK